MKTLFRLLAAALLLTAGSATADIVQLTLTVTNASGIDTNGASTLTIQSDTRTATNIVSSSPSKLWLGTNVLTRAATNLYQHVQIYKFGGSSPLSVRMTETNVIVFTAPPGVAISASLAGAWGTLVLSTNTTINQIPVVVPASAIGSAQTQTNVASGLVEYLDKATNGIGASAAALSNYTSVGTSQTISNKTLTHSVYTGGRIVNVTNLTGTNVALTNVTLHLLTATGADLTGNITLLSNGTVYATILDGVRPTNVYGLAGAVHQIIGGTWSNGTLTAASLLSPSLSNATIYGGTTITGAAVNLVGSGVNNFVSLTATSTVAAVGPIFYMARENGITNAVDAADVLGIIGFTGYGTTAQKVGARIRAIPMETFTDSTAGTILLFETTPSGSTTPVGRLHIGDTGIVTISNVLYAAATTNSNWRGTNTLNGRLDFASRSDTGLANGYNSGVILGTNVYIKQSGPSAGYTNVGFAASAAVDGTYHVVQADNPGLSFSLLHDSGLEATAANRIYTGTGALINSTNNPVIYSMIYDATVSRWRVVTFR